VFLQDHNPHDWRRTHEFENTFFRVLFFLRKKAVADYFKDRKKGGRQAEENKHEERVSKGTEER
jgi:hypothetical protein